MPLPEALHCHEANGLSQREAQALDGARCGQSFGQLCEQLGEPARAASLLHGWFNEGLVASASLGPQAD